MALYYLKGEEGSNDKESIALPPVTDHLPNPFLLVALCFIILLATILQFFAITWPVEERIIQYLPRIVLSNPPATPFVRLLELPATEGAFSPLDVAMTLRGLGKLHPSEILIAGKIADDPESNQLLQGVLNTTRAEGIGVLQAQVPHNNSTYHSLPLCQYTPPFVTPLVLETIPGKISNKDRGCFLPPAISTSQGIQLFARTSQSEVAGSIWLELLGYLIAGNKDATQKVTPSPWLLAGRALILPRHSTLLLNMSGAVPIAKTDTTAAKAVTQEDFLLASEQKERGENSSEFDALWNDTVVILGKESDLSTVTSLRHLAERLVWGRFSWITQLLIGGACILILMFTALRVRSRHVSAAMIAGLLITVTFAGFMLSFRHGVLIPWLPQVITTLSLLVYAFYPHAHGETRNN